VGHVILVRVEETTSVASAIYADMSAVCEGTRPRRGEMETSRWVGTQDTRTRLARVCMSTGKGQALFRSPYARVLGELVEEIATHRRVELRHCRVALRGAARLLGRPRRPTAQARNWC